MPKLFAKPEKPLAESELNRIKVIVEHMAMKTAKAREDAQASDAKQSPAIKSRL